ncbi:hypothetical protein [Congregibacter litoralis]|uniref:Shikimate kinase n=1 Tax=Congregibacter litoralis KT71 TaxID=314285 RepID=A4A7L9_9GAMM|nr:hypothetical protein [Congregibacter litoralis]EAQ98288.1 hypothetical protein KT71_03537 [Congregibacter litoralis KT71]
MEAGVFGSGLRGRLFTAVKYLTYLLLLGNVFLFLHEETQSLEHTFSGALSLSQYVQVFAATLDTAAWVVLLLLFELETSVLEDEKIRGSVKRAIHGVRMLCGAAIVWAFTGYCAELITLYQVTLLEAWNGCAQLGDGWSLLERLDEYAPLSAENCAVVADTAIRISDFNIVADAETLRATRYLAWTDVINAGAWILVVVVLEIEVRLQLRGSLTDAVVQGTRYLKYGLYSTLFIAAVYWGIAGKFLDFYDASLWLFAFIFIELNVFDWQRETQDVEQRL